MSPICCIVLSFCSIVSCYSLRLSACGGGDLTYFPIVVEEIDTKAAVFPEGSELKEKFDKAINELIEEGKIDELREKWFVVEAE